MPIEEELQSECGKLFVAAIDFGTTFSGYAFSAKAEWKKVFANNWNSGELISQKTPTALLLKPDKSFKAFGFDAETQYMKLAEGAEEKRDKPLSPDEDYRSHYFFHRFKMILHSNQNLSRKTMVEDVTGKPMEAATVFTHSIRYLKDHLMGSLGVKYSGIEPKDVLFVITVPAIWDDRAKSFMREAAIKAGIGDEQLRIALEPEAASIYCQYLPITSEQSAVHQSFYREVDAGKTYMVVDLGGGTADITVHKKCEDTNTLEEVIPASGGKWGGKTVDDSFFDFLREAFGKDLFEKFKRECMEDFILMSREFEVKKRSVHERKSSKVFMKTPLKLKKMVEAETQPKKKMSEILQESRYGTEVTFAQSTCKLKWEKLEDFLKYYETAVNGIVGHVESLYRDNPEIHEVKTIIVVGGFSECEVVQQALRKALPEKKIICPEEAGLAVLKGAVYFGHRPKVISRRSSRYTYGIQSWPEFNKNSHLQSKRVRIGDKDRCKDVFFKFVERGQHVQPPYERSQIFQVLKPEENRLECAVYISEKKNPAYIDEPGCRLLGILKVPLPTLAKDTYLELEETMIFGETELRVQARNVYNNSKVEIKFDLLD